MLISYCLLFSRVSKISKERKREKEIDRPRTVPCTVYRLTKYGRATNNLSQSRLNPCRSGFRSPVARLKSILARARSLGDRLLPLIFFPLPGQIQYLTNRKISRAAIRNLNWSGSEIWMDGRGGGSRAWLQSCNYTKPRILLLLLSHLSKNAFRGSNYFSIRYVHDSYFDRRVEPIESFHKG